MGAVLEERCELPGLDLEVDPLERGVRRIPSPVGRDERESRCERLHGGPRGAGALVGWAAGSVGLGILGGAFVGVPAGVLAVYMRYRNAF